MLFAIYPVEYRNVLDQEVTTVRHAEPPVKLGEAQYHCLAISPAQPIYLAEGEYRSYVMLSRRLKQVSPKERSI
jgi:hypothetical protein